MTELDARHWVVFERDFHEAEFYCSAYIRYYDSAQPDERILKALSVAVIVAYSRPFFRNEDDEGSYRAPKDFASFDIAVMQRVHEKVIGLRCSTVAHSDTRERQPTFTAGSSPDVDYKRTVEHFLHPEMVPVVACNADELEQRCKSRVRELRKQMELPPAAGTGDSFHSEWVNVITDDDRLQVKEMFLAPRRLQRALSVAP